jgi:hypothetical protein
LLGRLRSWLSWRRFRRERREANLQLHIWQCWHINQAMDCERVTLRTFQTICKLSILRRMIINVEKVKAENNSFQLEDIPNLICIITSSRRNYHNFFITTLLNLETPIGLFNDHQMFWGFN